MIVKELGIAPNDIAAMQKLSWNQLDEAAVAAGAKRKTSGTSTPSFFRCQRM